MVDPLKVLWVLTNSTYLVSKFLKSAGSEGEESPFFGRSLYRLEVAEDAEPHATLATVAADNHDELAHVRYEIVGGNLGDLFVIDPETAAISVTAPLDYETRKKYDLRISASDGESVSHTSLQITVLDVNDNPPVFDQSPYRAMVLEEDDKALPKRILKVSVSDADFARPADVVFSLTGPGVGAGDDPSGGKFAINATSGEVYVLKPLDRDPPAGRAQWRFTVFAQDEGGAGLVGYADIFLALRDVNDNAPVFPQPLAVANVTENSTTGLVVVKMTAEDADDPEEGGNAQLTYNIEKNVLDEQTGTPIFTIGPRTGIITTNICCLDREKTPDYTLQVVAVDGGGLKGTGTVSILVTDINDMPPSFTKDEWVTEVAESPDGGRPPERAVLTVNVVDQDESNDFYYTVLEGSGPGAELFTMVRNADDTGSLRLVRPLDYEDPGHRKGFRFKIQVNDQGPNRPAEADHVASSWVTVRVTDVNDNSPRFDRASASAALGEDSPVGAVVDRVRATDPDGAGLGPVAYAVRRESDPRRHFRIDGNGVVTLRRPLDRETCPVHKLVIEAVDSGEPARSATAALTVTVLDANDCPPALAASRVKVREGAPPGVLLEAAARDADDPAKGHGPPFTFALDPAATDPTLAQLFSVTTNHMIRSLVTFDREQRKQYLVPIVVEDAGHPPQSGTSTLTVVIGDVNDNSMEPGVAEILVYRLQGSDASQMVGRVYVDDPDDWDLADKKFSREAGGSTALAVDPDSGAVSVAAGTPPGLYHVTSRVRDARHLPVGVTANVTVRLHELPAALMRRAAQLTLLGTSDAELLKAGKLSVLTDQIVHLMALTEPQQITVLSVQTTSLSPVQTTVRFAIRESPGSDLPSFLDPVMLHGLILMHRQQVEEALSLPIVAVGPSLCAGEALCDSACDLVLSVGPDLYLVDGNSTQLAAPEVHEHARCECGPTLYEAPGACGQGYCLHGGVCRDTINGPKCSCPTPHDGPRCQQWSRGFQGGWAWFPPLAVCTPAHLSLEVRTARSDGLLLYNGPIGPPNPNFELVPDFISVELEEGRARLLLDLGSGTVNLTAPHRLDDDLWHRIDVLWDTEEVQLAVDWCRPVNGSDHVGCPIRFALPPAATLLNALSPLQLGGRRVSDIDPLDYGWSVTPRDLPLHGCLRNIVYNGVTLDLAEPALHDSTTPGCPDPPTTRCPRPPCGPRDPCPPGYVGPSCSAPTLPITLLSGGFVKYALSFEPDRRNSALQLRFRTRDTRAELFRLSDPRRRHFLILEISNGTVQARFCLSGQKPKEETVSLEHVTVSDGMWHYVKVEKQGSTVTLKLDDGEGRKHNESFKFEKEQLMSVDRQEGVYAGGVGDILFSQVCLDDVRVDGRPLPLPPSLNGSQWAQVLASRGAQAHCLTRSACADAVCPQSFACQDVWNDYVCTCGRGKMLSADGKACLDRNECLDNPCLNGGLCVNRERSAVGYACECPDGSWGQRCELLRERQSLSLGPGAVCAILGCLLLTLVLVALLVAYNRRREAPPIKKPDHCDDVRENIIGYNDEGGCEDDLHAFDLLPLKVELSLTDGAKLQVPELIEETGLQARIAGRRMREDRQHQQHLCGDDLRVYAHEGSCGSVAGSLSSLPSSDSEDEVLERLMRVGPRFTNILDIYACSSCPTGEESVV